MKLYLSLVSFLVCFTGITSVYAQHRGDRQGRVINIVTEKQPRRWFADASYSYGSFNTHKSYVHFGQALKNGFTYEVNAFQNYSDNDYRVDAPVKNFDTDSFNEAEKVRVRRFHDNYHNEAVVAKAGVTGKSWADRLMVGLTYSHMYKDIQTGVRQKTVFGEKHRYGHSLMPSLEYSKRDLLVEGLNVVLTANYNRNSTVNVDTARYQYNWLGERHELNSPGEQSYQYTRSDNDNWNGTLTANYNIGQAHLQRALPLCRLRRDLLLAQAGMQRQSAHTDIRQSVYAPFLLLSRDIRKR